MTDAFIDIKFIFNHIYDFVFLKGNYVLLLALLDSSEYSENLKKFNIYH